MSFDIRASSFRVLAGLSICVLVTACGDEALVGLFDDGGVPVTDANTADMASDAVDAGVSDTAIDGPLVYVHLRATTASFPHGDGYAGQTPGDQRVGIRGLYLSRSLDDPNPLVVFDHGANAVEAGLNDGDATVVGTVPARELTAGTFTYASVPASHVRYRVNATVHYNGMTVAGRFDNMQVLSDGSVVDGETRDSGYYRYTFGIGDNDLGSQEGHDAPVPLIPYTGGIGLEFVNGQAAYVFATLIQVDPEVTHDVHVIFEVNTFEDFRWEDVDEAGYQANVFDVEPPTFEPVHKFGANSFRTYLE